jgi:hypothetical protein
MATTASQSKQVLEAMKYFFGKRQCRSTLFVADVGGSLAAEHFELNVIDENYAEKQYYVWFDNGSSTDPSIVGKTGLQLTYTDGDSAVTIAGLYIALLATVEVLAVDSLNGLVQVENKFLGVVSVESYTNASSETLVVLRLGTGGELGAIQSGGATLTTEQDLETITKDSQGSIVQDLIQKGQTIALDMSLVEMDAGNWKSLIGEGYGDIEVVGSDEILGFGVSKLYKSSFDFAGQLVGHPTRLALSDRSADICLFLTPPQMSDITYSGQEAQSASFNFMGLPDNSKPASVRIFARGDHSLV